MTARALAAVLLVGGLSLLAGGCVSRRVVELDALHPSIRCSVSGIYFGNDRVNLVEVSRILEDYDIPHDRVIHIRLDPDVRDLREARALMVNLARCGYSRPILVTERHADSFSTGKRKPRQSSHGGGGAKARPAGKIRYKKAME